MKNKNVKNTKNKQENPFKGIKVIVILVLLFVLAVTIGIFYLLCIYKGAPKTDLDSLGDMQSATLAISAISVSFISGIVTILMFYRERKTELLNSMVKTNLSKVEKERNFLSRLLYLQSNNSGYLLRLQYDYLKSIGNDICDSDVDSRYKFLYIICSLLESRIAESNDKDINTKEIYDQIIKFSKEIIDDESIKDEMKTDAIFMYVNAHYKIFREDLVKNPASIDYQKMHQI